MAIFSIILLMSIQTNYYIQKQYNYSQDNQYLENFEDLKSDADCILYTCGVGATPSSQKQATPSYILELAQENPTKSYELIHCDNELFPESQGRSTFPVSLNEHDWSQKPSTQEHILRFQHKRLPNLQAKLICKMFPDLPEFHADFKGYIESNLHKGKEIFLGSHCHSWQDVTTTLAETYNHLREKYPQLIHFYIQAGEFGTPAFVYKSAYSPIMGAFAQRAFINFLTKQHPTQWEAFQRVFSQSPPSELDIEKVRETFKHFLANRIDGPRDDLSSGIPDEELYHYLKNPSRNLLVIPIEKITAELLKVDPAKDN